MILCWATFIAVLGCMWPEGRRLATPLPWMEDPEKLWHLPPPPLP